MLKLNKPEQKITKGGITYLIRTPEQVEQDLFHLVEENGRAGDEEFIAYWRKLLSAKIPICPVCNQSGGPIRRDAEGKVLGCDHCLCLQGYATDLIGVKEAAEILGWDPRKVATYRQRGSFPEPVAEMAMGPVWMREQIIIFKDLK